MFPSRIWVNGSVWKQRRFRSNRSKQFSFVLRNVPWTQTPANIGGYCAKLPEKTTLRRLLACEATEDLPTFLLLFTPNSIPFVFWEKLEKQISSDWSSQRNTNTTITKRVLWLIPSSDKVWVYAIFALEHGLHSTKKKGATPNWREADWNTFILTKNTHT